MKISKRSSRQITMKLLVLFSLALPLCQASSASHRWALSCGRQMDQFWTGRLSPQVGKSSRSFVSQVGRGGGAMMRKKTMTAAQMEGFNLLSGGVAGTVASCITNPLEVIKTQLQSSNSFKAGRGHPAEIAQKILAQDGPAGFFRGLPPTLVGIIPSRSIYFYVYQRMKHLLGPYVEEGSPLNSLVSGFLGGVASNTVSNPIWMVRTRMQILADVEAGQKVYAGYRDAIGTILREEGIGGFYKGIQASYWGCTEGALQFILYEQFKSRLLKRANQKRAAAGKPPTKELGKVTIFMSAAIAKMCGSVLTYPHEVARTRMREQAQSGIFKYKGMWQTLTVVAREEGRQGLYSGLGIHLIKVVPNSAFMFLTYELVRSWLSDFTIVDGNGAPVQR